MKKVGKILLLLILLVVPLFAVGCDNKETANWVEYRIIVVIRSGIESSSYSVYREFEEEEFTGSSWHESMKQYRCEKLYAKEENGYIFIKQVKYNGEETQSSFKLYECLVLKEKIKSEKTA